MLVAGDCEAGDGTVSVRSRAFGDLGPRAVDDFLRAALDEVARRELGGPRADAA
jgi:threonyl-tRNA synthetase